jgi:urease accessory protein
MTATARLLKQRSVGHVKLRMEAGGIAVLREAGSSKCRIPPHSREAILINTSGGLAGGDSVFIEAAAGANAELVLTTQAAERVYRSLGPAADVKVRLQAAPGATLMWMPNETIVFERGALTRLLDVELAEDATFLAVEPLVFGRHAMGEVVQSVSVHDRWAVRRSGQLLHAENFRLGPEWPDSKATFGNACAMATVLLVSPQAESLVDAVRTVLGPDDGASAWNGKLVARLLAIDGFEMRKVLLQVLSVVMGSDKLPKTWTF